MSAASNTPRRASACSPVPDERSHPRARRLPSAPESKAPAEAFRHAQSPRPHSASRKLPRESRRRRVPDRLSLPPPSPSDFAARISSEFRKHYPGPTRCWLHETTTSHSAPPLDPPTKHSSDAGRDRWHPVSNLRCPNCESSSSPKRSLKKPHTPPPPAIFRSLNPHSSRNP